VGGGDWEIWWGCRAFKRAVHLSGKSSTHPRFTLNSGYSVTFLLLLPEPIILHFLFGSTLQKLSTLHDYAQGDKIGPQGTQTGALPFLPRLSPSISKSNPFNHKADFLSRCHPGGVFFRKKYTLRTSLFFSASFDFAYRFSSIELTNNSALIFASYF